MTCFSGRYLNYKYLADYFIIMKIFYNFYVNNFIYNFIVTCHQSSAYLKAIGLLKYLTYDNIRKFYNDIL